MFFSPYTFITILSLSTLIDYFILLHFDSIISLVVINDFILLDEFIMNLVIQSIFLKHFLSLN